MWPVTCFTKYGQAALDARNASPDERRPFDGLVIDWYVIHIFAIAAILAMVIFNIYAWFVINNFREVNQATFSSFCWTNDFVQELRTTVKLRGEPRRDNHDSEDNHEHGVDERVQVGGYDRERRLPPLSQRF